MPRAKHIAIPDAELRFTFIRSRGPGGQNVNKVATAAQLFFDVRRSPSLDEQVKDRLVRLAGSLVSGDGVLVITARRRRSQWLNRQDALERLRALLARASVPPRPRRATRPTGASVRRRLESKRRRSEIKRLRRGGE